MTRKDNRDKSHDDSADDTIKESPFEDSPSESLTTGRRPILRALAGTGVAATFGTGLATATDSKDTRSEQQVTNLIERMTLEEKVRQITGKKAFIKETGYIPPIKS